MKILENRLLVAAVASLAFYWIVGPLIPKPFVANTMSLLSIGAGILLFSRYAETSYHILFRQERSEEGSHYAVLGATLAAMGIAYSGLFSLIWVYFGEPVTWSSTAMSSFGRGLVAVGFFAMAVSFDTVKVNGSYPKGFWRAICTMFAIVLAFVAGTHFSGS